MSLKTRGIIRYEYVIFRPFTGLFLIGFVFTVYKKFKLMPNTRTPTFEKDVNAVKKNFKKLKICVKQRYMSYWDLKHEKLPGSLSNIRQV